MSRTRSFADRIRCLQGLTSTPKWLSPKFFYDATGSELFELITELPEYYLTRTEARSSSSMRKR